MAGSAFRATLSRVRLSTNQARRNWVYEQNHRDTGGIAPSLPVEFDPEETLRKLSFTPDAVGRQARTACYLLLDGFTQEEAARRLSISETSLRRLLRSVGWAEG